jgi:hypothetical protein
VRTFVLSVTADTRKRFGDPVFHPNVKKNMKWTADRSTRRNRQNVGAFQWGGISVSVHQNLEGPKIDGYLFWDQNVCIVFDASSPIPSSGIDKVKHLPLTCIHIILLIFAIHRANRPWFKGQVIHATK